MLSQVMLDRIGVVVDFSAGMRTPGAPSGGQQNKGAAFESEVCAALSTFERENTNNSLLSFGGPKVFNIHGYRREFDHPCWTIKTDPEVSWKILFEAKSGKPRYNKGGREAADVDGNADERLDAQMQRAADIADQNLNNNYLLVICFNGVYEKVGMRRRAAFLEHARRLERSCRNLKITFLYNRKTYQDFFEGVLKICQ